MKKRNTCTLLLACMLLFIACGKRPEKETATQSTIVPTQGFVTTPTITPEEGELASNAGSVHKQENDPAIKAWWEGQLADGQEEGKVLTKQEMEKIVELAYLVNIPCMVATEEINKQDALFSMYTYYCMHDKYSYNPEASRITERYEFIVDLPYPIERFEEIEKECYVVVSVDTVIAFVKDVFGATLEEPYEGMRYPQKEERGIWKDEFQFACMDDQYYFYIGDYLMNAYFIEGYQYLGDSQYLILFAEDWFGTGDMDEPLIERDALHCIVERSDSPWGFTVNAIVKNGYSIIHSSWKQPENIVWVADAPSGYPSNRSWMERRGE